MTECVYGCMQIRALIALGSVVTVTMAALGLDCKVRQSMIAAVGPVALPRLSARAP